MKKAKPQKPSIPWALVLSLVCMVTGLTILLFLFVPILSIELDYAVRSMSQSRVLDASSSSRLADVSPTPMSTDFGIVIPKIHANAPIIQNIDAFDANVYQIALTKGIAQARGTSLPDEAGNVFLFAHSAQNWLNANRYNAVFYLLYKLEKGDAFSVYYKGSEYKYKVQEKKTVSAEDVDIMESTSYPRSVTLMTCWPPGTTFKRLVVVGELEKVSK